MTLYSSPLVSYAINFGIGACAILFSWFWTANTLAGRKAPRLDGENGSSFIFPLISFFVMDLFFLWNSRNDGFIHPTSLFWKSPDFWILAFLVAFAEACSFVGLSINTKEEELV